VNEGHLLTTPIAEQHFRDGNSFPAENLYRLKMLAVKRNNSILANDSPGQFLYLKNLNFCRLFYQPFAYAKWDEFFSTSKSTLLIQMMCWIELMCRRVNGIIAEQ
jgi:hypothetical protein